ncbi:1-deoxy-D-xylulose-5-phosphate synthase [bacterium]|nr:1-deoxy-D-xylulose-5-phosphate synthase [bacterium]
MRQTFINTLMELSRENKEIFLLTGDLGFSVFEKFKEQFPRRFFDVGVAEQNMIGIASGLALSGKIAFAYSIIPFLTMRCFEQIRNDICYQSTNVKLVGVGAGFAYGSAGFTHYAIEDIGIMRMLPNMVVVSPADTLEMELTVRRSIEHNGPVYIRIGRARETIYSTKQNFKLGIGITVKEGKDITIFSTGDILENVIKVAEKLTECNISSRVISMHTVKPIDKEIILKATKETRAIFTVEEHSVNGGLGSAVAEILSDYSCRNVLFKRIGISEIFVKEVGDYKYLREKHNLSANAIFKTIIGLL